MKKLFLFISIFILLTSGCATQQGKSILEGMTTLLKTPDIKPDIPQPPMRLDLTDLVRRLEALEIEILKGKKKPLTIEELKKLAEKAGASNFYGSIARTGGTSGSLDNIDGTNLATGDAAYCVESTGFRVYYLNAASGAGESDDTIISPDANAGNKRWELVFRGDLILGDIANLTPTDGNFIVGNDTTWVAESGATARASLGLIIGTDVLAEQSIGITDDYLVEVDGPGAGAPASGEYAKWTANGLEGKSIVEAIGDLAHKDYHDPENGADPLDTAAPPELAGVQDAAVGSAHSFARSDHAHQIQHSIANNHLATYDGNQNSGETCRMTADGIESRTDAEMKTQLAYLQAGDANNMADAELARPVLKDYGETVSVIGSDTTPEYDLENGNVFTDTIDTGETTATFSNPPASGTLGSLTLKLTNAGSQIYNWPASVDWPGGSVPSLTASGKDTIVCETLDGGTIWSCYTVGLDIKSP